MTRNYSKVTDDKRQRLIELINSNMTIKDAARSVDIKYENAKAIYRVYRKEQRTQKRRNRFRYKLPEGVSKNSPAAAKLREQAEIARANKKGKNKAAAADMMSDDEDIDDEMLQDDESAEEDDKEMSDSRKEARERMVASQSMAAANARPTRRSQQ